MKVNVLGEEYTIKFKDREDDSLLKDNIDGYCDKTIKQIIIENFIKDDYSVKDLNIYKNQVIRHELIHAFLNESGLQNCSWADNEELVDWLAIQLPKIFKSMKELEVI